MEHEGNKGIWKELRVIPGIIGIIQFIATLFTDPIIFNKVEYINFKMYWLIKPLAFMAIMIFWQGVFYIYRQIRKGDERVIKFSKYTGIYGTMTIILLLLTWPGVWRWDEFFIMYHAAKLEFFYWHHFLTGVFYIFSLCMIPCPGGVVFVQVSLISLMVGTIMYELSKFVDGKWIYLMYIPYMLPAILTNDMYPMRIVLYSHIETTLLCLVFFTALKKTEIRYKLILIWGILSGIVCSWRSEGIAYIVLLPLLIYVLLGKRIGYKKIGAYMITTLIVTGSVKVIQARGDRDNDYFLTGVSEPLHGIISNEFNSESPEEDLKVIDKVLSVELLKTTTGDYAYWSGKRKYTEEELKEFKSVYYRLILKNIPLFLKNRVKIFIEANGMIMDIKTQCGATPDMYSYDDDKLKNEFFREAKLFVESYRFNRPLNIRLRSEILSTMECRYPNDYNKTIYLHPVFYNSLPVIVVTTGICIYFITKSRYKYALIPAIPVLKAGLIFMTAPINVFMYYLPIYVFGVCFITIFFLLKFRGPEGIV